MSRNFLVVDPSERPDVLRALASEVRVAILKLLHSEGPLNVNDIAARLGQPQSTISSNMQVLVDAALVRTETQKARKGNQKICHSLFDEVLVMFKEDISELRSNSIEVAMPLGLYTSCEVSAPCGICSSEGIIGLLDVPDTFLDPDRMKAGLLWFTRGYVEYQFPNNARLAKQRITSMEFSVEAQRTPEQSQSPSRCKCLRRSRKSDLELMSELMSQKSEGPNLNLSSPSDSRHSSFVDCL